LDEIIDAINSGDLPFTRSWTLARSKPANANLRRIRESKECPGSPAVAALIGHDNRRPAAPCLLI
jgi:hypothetical protein